MCADSAIQKMPSAPRLNFGGHQVRDPEQTLQGQAATSASTAMEPLRNEAVRSDKPEHSSLDRLNPDAQAAFLTALRQVVANTEDVGQRFADEARRMHYGEAEARSIRGQASAREAVELLEEGIEVMPLPMLPALKETLQ